MSIINEALKKTEQYIQKNAEKENLLLNSKPNVKPILLYILILLIGLFLGNTIFNLLRSKTKPIKSAEKIDLGNEKTVTPVVLLSTPILSTIPSTNKDEFVLNGIFFSDNDGYALVNNQIVRENDLVDGTKVSKITANTVELKQEDKIITLSTHM